MDNQDDGWKFSEILKLVKTLNPSLQPYDDSAVKAIFSQIKETPDHPPYAHMILKAISELNDGKGCCSEEAISEAICNEYKNSLPVAHSGYLRHHLKKLVTRGQIICDAANCYALPSEDSGSVHKSKKRKGKQIKRKCRQHQQLRIEGLEHDDELNSESSRGEKMKLKEQQIEVCQQIMDLSNKLLHFIGKTEDKDTVSIQYDTANLADFSSSSNLNQEQWMQLLEKTNDIRAKLNDIIEKKKSINPTTMGNELQAEQSGVSKSQPNQILASDQIYKLA